MGARALLARIPHSFWRFGLVGIGGLFVDMAALYAVIWGLGLSPVPAKVVSFLAAATFTWWMNRRYTFGSSGKSLLHEWASFLATNAFGGAVNFAVYSAMVTQLFAYVWMPALATAAGSVSGLLFNYTASRHIVFKKPRRPKTAQADSRVDAPPLPRLAYPLTALVCLGFGGVALGLGMDGNWDLQNYHLHNGWAFVNGLVGRDLLVPVSNQCFHNPILDVPYALAFERLPARAIGFVLGALHGLNFLPLFAIAWRLSTQPDWRRRLGVSTALAMAGLVGAGGLSEVGLVFYDNVLSLGVSTAALLVVWRWDLLAQGRGWAGVAWVLAAGFCVGLAFGLKQTMVFYCVGWCAAFLIADLPWWRRVGLGFWFGVGVLAGFAAGGGYWAWHLWETYGNPLFPYYNHVFRSPWTGPESYVDDHYLPRSWAEGLLLAYRFSFDPHLVGEVVFRDLRIPALVTLIPLAAVAGGWRKQAQPFTLPGPTGWLLAAGFLSYAVWVPMFSIYRYLVPLEMLAPTLLFAAIGLLPGAAKTRQYAAAGLLGAVVLATVPGDWMRVPWRERAVEVEGVAELSLPANTLVLISGYEPMSYLIPAFPKSLRFYRIGSNFILPADPEIGFRKIFRDAIRDNPGPIASMHVATERPQTVKTLPGYGLALDLPSCRPLASPVSPTDYAFCLARRVGR